MASQTHQHLITIFTTKTKPEPRKNEASRGLWKLVVAVSVPMVITIAIVLLFGSRRKYYMDVLATPIFWFPPLWFIHLASLCSSFLMGLAGWLVWADGGFHSQSDALPLYIAQISLSIVWDPLVLVIGVAWLGFVFCVIHLGTLFACYLSFQRVNTFAKDLVTPCLAWVLYLIFVSSKLTYLSQNFIV